MIWIRGTVQLIGIGLLWYGLSMVYAPLPFIVVGALLFAVAFASDMVRGGDPDAERPVQPDPPGRA